MGGLHVSVKRRFLNHLFGVVIFFRDSRAVRFVGDVSCSKAADHHQL